MITFNPHISAETEIRYVHVTESPPFFITFIYFIATGKIPHLLQYVYIYSPTQYKVAVFSIEHNIHVLPCLQTFTSQDF